MEKSRLPQKDKLSKKQQDAMFRRMTKFMDKALKDAGQTKDFRQLFFSQTPVGSYLREASLGFLVGAGAKEEEMKALLEYLDKN